ncbi:MAG: ATP-binding protein [candidate division WOR-3 bacterium]
MNFDILTFESKLFKTIEKYRLIKNGDVIFVGLSGGKDSITTLRILQKYVENSPIKAKITGFHLNLGFDYSDELENFVKEICVNFNIECIISKVRDFNLNLQQISKYKRRPVCSICGQVKRYLMNKVPRDNGATKFATGHHLDDFLIFYMKNFIYKNFEWSFKILPKVKSSNPKLLTKIRPLIFASNEEIKNYVRSQNLPTFPKACPYSLGGGCFTDPRTLKFREVIEKTNGIVDNFKQEMMYSIITFNNKFASKLTREDNLKFCSLCGEPTSNEVCAFCRLIDLSKKLANRSI